MDRQDQAARRVRNEDTRWARWLAAPFGGKVTGEGMVGLYPARDSKTGHATFWRAYEVVTAFAEARLNGLPNHNVT